MGWTDLLCPSSDTLEHQRALCEITVVRCLAHGDSRGGIGILESGFCLADFGPIDSQADVGLAVGSDDDLLFAHELDIPDGTRGGATCERDLDAESGAGMGHARNGILAARTDHFQGLDDVGIMHQRSPFYSHDGDTPCSVFGKEPMVVSLVGDRVRASLCRGDLVTAIASRFGSRVADRAEPYRDGGGDVADRTWNRSKYPNRPNVVPADRDRSDSNGKPLLALCQGAEIDPQSYCIVDHIARTGFATSLGPFGSKWRA